jgi:hypothetical protein
VPPGWDYTRSDSIATVIEVGSRANRKLGNCGSVVRFNFLFAKLSAITERQVVVLSERRGDWKVAVVIASRSNPFQRKE